jgi:hypothetical protein
MMYKALPEEGASFTADGIVKAESSLVRAERDFEFAEIAVQHAEDVLRSVEDRLLAEIANERTPAPELEADHADLVARLKRLHEAADKIKNRRSMLEDYVRGGSSD